MSKFKIGDEVMLLPDSKWVGRRSNHPNSTNPTGVVGKIVKEHKDAHKEDTEFQWHVDWSNDTSNAYHSDDLLLVTGVSVRVETNLHEIIEEQAAHIENLEEALEVVTKELIELREEQSVSTDTAFKPITDMTLEDWYTAKAEGWVFEMDDDEVYVAGVLDEFKDSNHPIEVNLVSTNLHHGTLSEEGYFYHNKPNHPRNIKRRIK